MIDFSDPYQRFKGIIVLVLLACTPLVFALFYFFKEDSLETNYLVLQQDEAIMDTVVYYQPIGNSIKLKFGNGLKRIVSNARNYAYEPKDLVNFIQEGDYFKKKAESDTVIISRNGEEYIFVHGQVLNPK